MYEVTNFLLLLSFDISTAMRIVTCTFSSNSQAIFFFWFIRGQEDFYRSHKETDHDK